MVSLAKYEEHPIKKASKFLKPNVILSCVYLICILRDVKLKYWYIYTSLKFF